MKKKQKKQKNKYGNVYYNEISVVAYESEE